MIVQYVQKKAHQNNYNVHVCLVLHTKNIHNPKYQKKENKKSKIHNKLAHAKKAWEFNILRVALAFVDCSHCLRNTKCASARAPKQLQCACILDCPHRKITFQ